MAGELEFGVWEKIVLELFDRHPYSVTREELYERHRPRSAAGAIRALEGRGVIEVALDGQRCWLTQPAIEALSLFELGVRDA